jgi:hypothetical protein
MPAPQADCYLSHETNCLNNNNERRKAESYKKLRGPEPLIRRGTKPHNFFAAVIPPDRSGYYNAPLTDCKKKNVIFCKIFTMSKQNMTSGYAHVATAASAVPVRAQPDRRLLKSRQQKRRQAPTYFCRDA